MKTKAARWWTTAVAVAVSLAGPALAAGPLVPGWVTDPGRLSAQEKPTLTEEDYGKWERLGSARISPDGGWLAVQVSRVNDEDELRIHHTGSDSVVVVPYGAGPRSATTAGGSPTPSACPRKRPRRPRRPTGPCGTSSGF